MAWGRTHDDGLNAQGAYVGARLNPREQAEEPTQFVEHQRWLDKQWINRGSIASIRLGPSEHAAGINGSIGAFLGRIYSIRSTGEIRGSQIVAGDGALEVRIHKWNEAGDTNKTPLNKDLAVTQIKAFLPIYNTTEETVQSVGSNASDTYAQTIAKARNQGAVHLIETGGEFSGTVTCKNLIDAGDDRPNLRDSRGRSGIIVWDNLQVRGEEAPPLSVKVAHLGHNVCVIAPNLHDVEFGWQFKGTINAYGSKAYPDGKSGDRPITGGEIFYLSIGADAKFTDAVARDRYPGMLPGLVGGYRPPVDLNPAHPAVDEVTAPPLVSDARQLNEVGFPIEHEHPVLWDHDRYLWALPASGGVYGLDEGSLDPVVRAERLIETKCQVFGMHQRIFEKSQPAELVVASYRPRIEAPSIYQVGIPGTFFLPQDAPYNEYCGIFEGVIWSGAVEHRPDIPDAFWEWHGSVWGWYATLSHDCYVQRIGPGGDIWGDNVPVHVNRDMCGEIHTRLLMPGARGIWIGSRLGDDSDWAYPSYVNGAADTLRPQSVEPTPRGRALLGPMQTEADVAPTGAVYVGHNYPELYGATELAVPLRLESGCGVIVNLGFVDNPLDPNAFWDVPSGAPPIFNDPLDAWSGFVRVGDPWVDAARVYTLAPTTPFGTSPEPDATFDVFSDPRWTPGSSTPPKPPRYRRHSWDLAGAEDLAWEFRGGGYVGVYPFGLHIDDCAPVFAGWGPPDNAGAYPLAAPDDPNEYQVLPTEKWVERWPLDAPVLNATLDEYGGTGLRAVRLRFYGPITTTHADGTFLDVPVKISEWTGAAWDQIDLRDPQTDDYGDNFFDYRIVDTDLYLGPRCNKLIRGGIFKIEQFDPNDPAFPNRLRCATSTSELDEAPASFTWYVRLLHKCADIGKTGGVPGSDGVFDNNDFVVFVDYFFNHHPIADIGMTGGVFGSDGVWDNNDFVVFIDLFFSHEGCVYRNCNGFVGEGEGGGNIPNPGAAQGRAGGGEQPMGTQSGENPDPTAEIRAALQQMIASEPPGPRRDTLQGMLNALPPPPNGN